MAYARSTFGCGATFSRFHFAPYSYLISIIDFWTVHFFAAQYCSIARCRARDSHRCARLIHQLQFLRFSKPSSKARKNVDAALFNLLCTCFTVPAVTISGSHALCNRSPLIPQLYRPVLWLSIQQFGYSERFPEGGRTMCLYGAVHVCCAYQVTRRPGKHKRSKD